MCSENADADVLNCTFIANGVNYGIFANGDCNTTVTNCILWGNGDVQISGDANDANVTYSDIQDGWPGVGNIDEDPMLEVDGIHLSPCSP